MNERAFRLDFFIAMSALVVSALTAGTLIYQTHVIANQYAAAIWPYLSVRSTYDPHGLMLQISNDGLGPALIGSAELSVDGKAAPAWNDLVLTLKREPQLRRAFLENRAAYLSGTNNPFKGGTIQASSIGPSDTLRPGDSETLLRLTFIGLVPTQAFLQHPVALRFCYCSLNGMCWILRALPGQNGGTQPRGVSHCSGSASIASNAYAVPPSRPTKRRL